MTQQNSFLTRVNRFLAYPLNLKINTILKKILLVKEVLLSSVGMFFAKFFINSHVGRSIFFENLPKNEFVFSKTSEGICYLVSTSDKIIGKSIYVEKKSFDAQHIFNAVSLIPEKKTILLDVGANIGTIGIEALSKNYFERCISFEPEPSNFKLLELNVSLNGLDKKFELRNEALSNERGKSIEFQLSNINHGDHRVHIPGAVGQHEEDNRKIISVNVNTLDTVIKDEDISKSFLFMDTQGFEGHVLMGAKKLISKNIPIVTEFWPYGLIRANGLHLFYEALSTTKYTSMWDLRYPAIRLDFSIRTLKKIQQDLGENGAHTDLLFINEQAETM